jgi:hypothetical protein
MQHIQGQNKRSEYNFDDFLKLIVEISWKYSWISNYWKDSSAIYYLVYTLN